jgi:predicted PhzF superfamily epimerase YddE/YHI9
MPQLACEFNLSETVFVLPWRGRGREAPHLHAAAGAAVHPLLGTGAFSPGVTGRPDLTFQADAGMVAVTARQEREGQPGRQVAWMEQLLPHRTRLDEGL